MGDIEAMTYRLATLATLATHRCQATIYVRDTLRYTGRGPTGFTMYFTERKCRRRAKGLGLCWQHLRRKTL